MVRRTTAITRQIGVAMQPEHEVEIPGEEAAQRLPDQLAQGLAPKAKHALMHATRRRILRALSEGRAVRTPKELLRVFPGVGLDVINYHLLVLEDCGSLAVSHVEWGPAAGSRAQSPRTSLATLNTSWLCGQPSSWTMFIDERPGRRQDR